ncbi:hypothetical protein T310_8996, partial [Rasamsonia emersonii CBS 393.64]
PSALEQLQLLFKLSVRTVELLLFLLIIIVERRDVGWCNIPQWLRAKQGARRDESLVGAYFSRRSSGGDESFSALSTATAVCHLGRSVLPVPGQ